MKIAGCGYAVNYRTSVKKTERQIDKEEGSRQTEAKEI
jgi:hypothetical protein